MALVKGTNCGFVTAAPSGDPGETASVIDNAAQALKDTSPAGAVKVTEIGWYCENATEESNFEAGIYDHNIGDDNPEALVGKSATTAKGTGLGWKRVTGLDITITAETIYWLAVQLDNTATDTNIDGANDAGEKIDVKGAQTTLTDPWAVSAASYGQLIAVYAVYEVAVSAEAGKSGSIREESPQGDNDHGLY